ncbi:MAG: polysaccharide pyruvyl transferase family protein [Candidatus Bathyarchaeia archaeon]
MRIAVIGGAGGTLGDDMVFHVIKDWLSELGVEEVYHTLPCSEDAIKKADGVILGGCGIIYDEGVVLDVKGNAEKYHTYISLAKKHGIPAMGFGIGWQGLPLTTGKNLWIETLNALDMITVWRGGTKQYLESIGVDTKIVETADLGFALQPTGNPINCDIALLSHSPRLMAIDCHKPEWEKPLFQKLKSSFETLSQSHSIIVVPFVKETLELLQVAESSYGVLIQGEPHRILGAVKGARICVTTTLHGLIMAATAGCRILALYPPEPLKPKIRLMVEELGVRSLPFDTDWQRIVREIELAENDAPPNIAFQIEQNRVNKSILESWLKGL